MPSFQTISWVPWNRRSLVADKQSSLLCIWIFWHYPDIAFINAASTKSLTLELTLPGALRGCLQQGNAGTQVPYEELGPWDCWRHFHRPQEYQTYTYQCNSLPLLFTMRSWRGTTGRLEKFWPWWTSASLIKGNPVIRTEGTVPKSKLKTFPYFFTNWKIVEKLQLHMHISVCPGMEGMWSFGSLY